VSTLSSSTIFRRSSASIIFGVLALCAAVAAIASDDDGEMHSLDSVDTGETHSLDSVDTGQTHSLDSVDTGRTHSVDSVDALADERRARPAAPAPEAFPTIVDGDWQDQARRAKQLISEAEQRLEAANGAYSSMLTRDYPRGDARAKIIEDRESAEAHLNESWAYYGTIKRRALDAGHPL
jgi:hypothetical protein